MFSRFSHRHSLLMCTSLNYSGETLNDVKMLEKLKVNLKHVNLSRPNEILHSPAIGRMMSMQKKLSAVVSRHNNFILEVTKYITRVHRCRAWKSGYVA